MPIRVYYRLRADTLPTAGKKQLMIRLTIDGERLNTDYASGVWVVPDLWDQKEQVCRGRSQAASLVNTQLADIEVAHARILADLHLRYAKGQGPRPRPDLVRSEWQTPGATDPDLLTFYDTYVQYALSLEGTEDGRGHKTMDRLRTSRRHLTQFLPGYLEKKAHRGRYTLRDVNAAMGKAFHAWLQLDPLTGRRRMQKDGANKHLASLRECLDYAIDNDYLATNPLDKFRPTRGRGKAVYFLDAPHVKALGKLTTDDAQLGYVLWWTRLMCYTGLDYADAQTYARDREPHHRLTSQGTIIWIRRAKPPRNYCEIPLLAEVEALFAQYPTGPHAPLLPDLNRHLKVVQAAIGFTGRDSEGKSYRFTSKICRKSAGAIFLRLGYRIEKVSSILGHSSVRTTLQYYLTMQALSMEVEMERVARMSKPPMRQGMRRVAQKTGSGVVEK